MNSNEPLAFRMRPKTLDDYVGQEHVLGKDKILYRTIKADRLSSIILFGPPGCGKTSLARVISETTKYKFYKINAVTSGVAREDDISIYGFNTNEELRMFELLLSVSGVGAKTALTMLAVFSPSEFALSVISDDVATLTRIPGIGPKSAQRIILELKDKLKKEENISKTNNLQIKAAVIDDNKVQEAISALQVLGYNKKEIEKAFMKIDKTGLSTEELIRKGLTILA